MAMGPKLRDELKNDLVKNRSEHGSGSGNDYWEAVVDTVEAFLDRHFLDGI